MYALSIRTSSLSQKLAVYKLGSDATFLTKMTKYIFQKYLDTYITWVYSELEQHESVKYASKRLNCAHFDFISWCACTCTVLYMYMHRTCTCLRLGFGTSWLVLVYRKETKFLCDRNASVLHRFYASKGHQKKNVTSGGWALVTQGLWSACNDLLCPCLQTGISRYVNRVFKRSSCMTPKTSNMQYLSLSLLCIKTALKHIATLMHN